MSRPKFEKYILIGLLACMAILMPILSLDAGISGDEEVHLKHAHKVINYFSSFGENKAAINTPVTNLKYYGQSFDNFTTLLAGFFQNQDIYTIRHICNSLAGWLCILFAALLSIHLSGYRAAIFTALLLAVSPRFIGHSFNNLKDIPFALGYIASIYYIIKINSALPKIKYKNAIGLILSMAFILSIRPGGLLVFCYFILITCIYLLQELTNKRIEKKELFQIIKDIAFISLTAYLIGLLFWPYALENLLFHPYESMRIMSHYPITIRQLFEGEIFWSDQLPWYYLLKYVAITIPLIVFPLVLIYILRLSPKKKKFITRGFLLFTVLFPFLYTIVAQSNVYGAWRHLLFIYPPLIVMSAVGLDQLISIAKKRWIKIGILGIFAISLISPLKFIIKNHPIEYTYFNQLAGDFNSISNNYELDYYYHSSEKASKWLQQHIENEKLDSIKIASNYNLAHYSANFKNEISFKYVPYYARGNVDWDYGIFYRTLVSPSQTKQNIWPPVGTIKSIKVENIPVCVIVKRQTKNDYFGKIAYENKEYKRAENLLLKASKIDPANEITWINLGKTYLKQKKYTIAKSSFMQCLNIIPAYEPALYYLAQTEIILKNPEKAEEYYRKILNANNKSFKTYLAFAKLKENNFQYIQAIKLLNECLYWNPNYDEAKILRLTINKKLKGNIKKDNPN